MKSAKKDALNKTWNQDSPRYSDESAQSTALHRAADSANKSASGQTVRTLLTAVLFVPGYWLAAAGVVHGNVWLGLLAALWLIGWGVMTYILWRK